MACKWKVVAAKGETPTPRYGHGMAVVGDSAYMFGGTNGQTMSSDTFKLDLTGFSWQKLPPRGSLLPCKREGHSLTTVGNSIFLFGGVDEKDEGLNDIFSFDIPSQTWKMLMAPNAPSPRNNHSAAAYGSKLFIFGGFCDGAVLNDLYIFDTERNGWISLEAKGPKPPARCDATLTAVGNKLVLFGGASDGIWFNDVHVFDVDSRTWTQPRISGAVPPKRDYHSAAAVDRNVVVFGGTCEGENSSVLYNDVYLFNVDSGAWTKAVPSGSAPAARWGHSAVSYRGEVIVHGGCSTPSLIFNDVCVLDTSAADEPVPLPKPARSVGGAPAPAARPLPLPKGQPATPAPRPGAIATPLAGAGQAGGAPSPAARPGQGGSSASLANVNPASLKVTGGLQAPQPIPAGRPSYATHTPIPAPRKPAPSVKPRETTTKDYSEHLARSKASLQAIYTEVEGLFADLDAERAQLQADKAQFAEEKRMNQEQHDQQQSELKALQAKLQKDNEVYMQQIQVQYDEKLNEIKRKQAELQVEEDQLRKDQDELEEKKKQIGALIGQFSGLKA